MRPHQTDRVAREAAITNCDDVSSSRWLSLIVRVSAALLLSICVGGFTAGEGFAQDASAAEVEPTDVVADPIADPIDEFDEFDEFDELDEAAGDDPEEDPDDVSSEDPRNVGIEELTVTAAKRKQSVQDVPISVTALGGDFLEEQGTTSFAELQKFVPNLQILPVTDTRSTSIRIRGIGSVGSNAGIDPSVGVFIDGVYQGRAGMSVNDLLDIERVEVLRGPQGTLYGKNTAAGAISVITRNPTDEFEFYGETVIGNYGQTEVRGSINVPIIDETLATRVSGYRVLRDGYDTNRFTGERVNSSDKWGTRAKVLWQPTDSLELIVNGDYSLDASKCCVADIIQYGGPNSLGVNFDDLARASGVPLAEEDPFDRIVGANIDPQNRVTVGGVALGATQEVGDLELSWLNAYRSYTSDSQFDGDFSIYDAVYSNTQVDYYQFSSELLLVSPGGETIEYQVGLYYFMSQLETVDVLGWSNLFAAESLILRNTGAAFNVNDNTHNAYSAAGFGQATWNIAEAWSLTGGFRIDYERKRRDGSSKSFSDPSFPNPCSNLNAPPVCGEDNVRDESRQVWNPQGTAILRYRPTDDVMVYTSVANGFKSGGFNQLRTQGNSAATALKSEFDDERSLNVELGTKTTWLDGGLLFNLTGYFTDYRDFQAQLFDGASITVDNAGRMFSTGVESELRWIPEFIPDQGLVVGGSLGLNYAWYNDYDGAPATLPQQAELTNSQDLVAIRCGNTTLVPDGCQQDLTGQRIDNAPRVTLTLFSSYEHEIPGTQFIWYASGNYLYESFKYLDTDLDSNLIQDPIHLLGLRTGFKLDDQRLDISFWVDNTLNQNWLVTGADVPIVSGYMGVAAPPRTFGGTIRFRY